MATTRKPKVAVDPDVKEPIEVAEPVKEETPKVLYGTVTAARLNVRQNPSTEAPVVAVASLDDELKIERDKSNKEWYFVTTEKRVRGYCMRKFIKIKR